MDLRIAFIPVGRFDVAEVEAVATRVAKVIHGTVELREPAPVPKAGDDPGRKQHLAGPMLGALRADLPRLKAAKRIGSTPGTAAPPGPPDLAMFFTDVDLFRPQTDGVFGEIDAKGKAAVLSSRRLLEAFYKRKTDPVKQRARLVKLTLMTLGRLRGLPDCGDRGCAMFTTAALADVDLKPEKYCASCWHRLSTGGFHI
ncbi:MAG TPA: archaemetzincin [Candidatus Polarisedimenticolaceae bacterium]|nr:archaemetzincin [Candidatus Polarisedimenticolaceae bacterium]